VIPLWVKALAVAAVVAAAVTACNKRDEGLLERGRSEQRVIDQAAQDRLKADAQTALDAETARVRKAEEALATLTHQMEVEREKSQAAVRAAARVTPRLQYAAPAASGCRPSSDSAKTAPSEAASDPAPAVIQLPDPIAADIWGYAADAESLAVDYAVLYRWANNPKLSCVLEE
jgi:predicted transcriptional regulator